MTIEHDLMLARDASPYGTIGGEAGSHVLGLLENLLAPQAPKPSGLGQTPRWDDADKDAFGYIIELDEDMRCLDPSIEEGSGSTGNTHTAWQALTVSLPFSEGERAWLIRALDRPSGRSHQPSVRSRYPTAFLPEKATVISAGVRQTIDPLDLVRRWASWRRETDEFANQGNITRAIFLLDHLAYELVPKMFTTPGFRKAYPHIGSFDARVHAESLAT